MITDIPGHPSQANRGNIKHPQILCVDGTEEHEWDVISNGVRCDTCELTILTAD